MRTKFVVIVASLGLVLGLGAAALASGGQSAAHKPSFAGQPSSTGLDRATQVVTVLHGAHPDATGLSTALESATANASKGEAHQTEQGQSSAHKPSFAGQPSSTGLARAEEVLTALQTAHPDADGLDTALSQVQAAATAHATGESH